MVLPLHTQGSKVFIREAKQKLRKSRRTAAGEGPSSQPPAKRARIAEASAEEEEEDLPERPLVRRRRTPAVTAAALSRAIPEAQEEDSEASTSEDEITAQEQVEMNATLAALGGSPLRMPPIPLAVVYNESAPESATQEKPIEVLSDSEEKMAMANIPAAEDTVVAAAAADVSGNLGAQGLPAVPDQGMEPEAVFTSQVVESAEASLEAGAETLLQLNQDALVEDTPLMEAAPDQGLTEERAVAEAIPEPEQNTGTADEEMADAPETANDGQENPEASRNEDQNQNPPSASLVHPQEAAVLPSSILLQTDAAANNPVMAENVANPAVDPLRDNTSSSSSQALPLEERLKQLLEVEGEDQSIQAAKVFLRNLADLKLDDTKIFAATREHAALLEAHVSGRELATIKALQAKLEALPILGQKAHDLSRVVKEYAAVHADLETKHAENRKCLQQRRTHVAGCDEKLATLETMRIDLKKKFAFYQQRRAEQSALLANEVSAAEQLKRALAKTQEDLTHATFEAEDQIVEFQKTIVDITSLGRRL